MQRLRCTLYLNVFFARSCHKSCNAWIKYPRRNINISNRIQISRARIFKLEARESIDPRNQFRQPMSIAWRAGTTILLGSKLPIDCLKIPALYCLKIPSLFSAGIFKQSMGAWNRVVPARQAWGLDSLESIPGLLGFKNTVSACRKGWRRAE